MLPYWTKKKLVCLIKRFDQIVVLGQASVKYEFTFFCASHHLYIFGYSDVFIGTWIHLSPLHDRITQWGINRTTTLVWWSFDVCCVCCLLSVTKKDKLKHLIYIRLDVYVIILTGRKPWGRFRKQLRYYIFQVAWRTLKCFVEKPEGCISL